MPKIDVSPTLYARSGIAVCVEDTFPLPCTLPVLRWSTVNSESSVSSICSNCVDVEELSSGI